MQAVEPGIHHLPSEHEGGLHVDKKNHIQGSYCACGELYNLCRHPMLGN